MRLFIALDIPDTNEQNEPNQLSNIQLFLSQSLTHFKPTRRLHITLLFLGEFPDAQLPFIQTILEESVNKFIGDYKHGLANGITGLIIKPDLLIMGKNAVALQVSHNILLDHLLSLLLQNLKPYTSSIRINNERNLHITLGRIPLNNEEHFVIEQIIKKIQIPQNIYTPVQTVCVKTITLYQSLPGSEYIAQATHRI